MGLNTTGFIIMPLPIPDNNQPYVYQDQILPIQKLKGGVNKKIMNKIISQINGMLTIYSRLLLVRVDIRLYQTNGKNTLIGKLMKQLVRALESHYKSKVGFFWVREQSTPKNNIHYHCFMMLDGRKAKNSFGLKPHFERACYLLADINYYFPDNCNYVINRNDINSLLLAIYRTSYLAKNHTKEFTPVGIRRFGCRSTQEK
ncbi:inovirus-type Gp2 protein [Shewanella sp. SG44-2]|uniref:YagK/YfjJ domain-containing protein n=2 Tax=Shewanella TaxID=22 RepID=UPI0016010194|nr:inovirus-type Gp2 protein [Shewanella sp. SG44-2]MBB1427628.1 inovirus-type Gp2 protein [Shewanella sp. SG44-2]